MIRHSELYMNQLHIFAPPFPHSQNPPRVLNEQIFTSCTADIETKTSVT